MLSELEPSLSLSYQIELVATAGESLHFSLEAEIPAGLARKSRVLLQQSSRSEHFQFSHRRLSSLLGWWPNNSHPRCESGYFFKL